MVTQDHNRAVTPAQLQRSRAEIGVSYRALAAEAKMSMPTVYNTLNGRNDPHLSTLMRIAAALEALRSGVAGCMSKVSSDEV